MNLHVKIHSYTKSIESRWLQAFLDFRDFDFKELPFIAPLTFY